MWLGILTPPMLCGFFCVFEHTMCVILWGLSVQLQPGACRWQQLSGCGSGRDRRIEAVSVSGVLPPEPHSYLADDRPGPDCGWDPGHQHWAEPPPSSTTDTYSRLLDWNSQSEWGSAEKWTLSIRWCQHLMWLLIKCVSYLADVCLQVSKVSLQVTQCT